MDEIDPFEARLLFSNMLDNLTGAQPTIDRVSSFAVKNSSVADNLMDCILEKLDKLSIAPRLNLLFVVDSILAASGRSTTTEWHGLVAKEVFAIVQAAIPENSSGDGNIQQARKIVNGWKRKGYFDKMLMDKIEKLFANRVGGNTATGSGMRHQEILKRIEEDRERHKRHKEDLWIRPVDEPEEDELSVYLETTSDFNDADWQEISEENETYRQEIRVLDIIKNSV
ncbi:hypothetical protein FBU59_001152 [Linderina macrospora]|uniref:Uncharacterized protein n=1 Tax=Linderina macrospora TaxID=4868 RepID=A0ACC1JF30_9FUNG|nr:hypothetical protein FBU59_001152 [Linderina macrospora]